MKDVRDLRDWTMPDVKPTIDGPQTSHGFRVAVVPSGHLPIETLTLNT